MILASVMASEFDWSKGLGIVEAESRVALLIAERYRRSAFWEGLKSMRRARERAAALYLSRLLSIFG